MKIHVHPGRIEFYTKKREKAPEVYRLAGVERQGGFAVNPELVLRTEDQKVFFCNVGPGVYAVFAHEAFLVLLPQRVRLTVQVARELLEEPPEPRVLEDGIAATLSDLITKGATWADATRVLGVGSN